MRYRRKIAMQIVIIYVDESLTEYRTSHDKGGESFPR